MGSWSGRSSVITFPSAVVLIPHPVTLTQVRPALNHLLRLLREKSVLREGGRHWPIDAVIEQFAVYLREVGGLSEATCMPRTRYAREFLEKKFGRRGPRWSTLRPGDVISFVKSYAQRVRPSSTQVAASSIRCFLRYLQAQGWCGASLVAAVPRIAHWRLSSLPKALGEDQVREFLATFDRSRATGLRDYAMALCQVVLGLRVGEVANLRLDDFNWRNGHCASQCRQGSLRTHELPLPVQVRERARSLPPRWASGRSSAGMYSSGTGGPVVPQSVRR